MRWETLVLPPDNENEPAPASEGAPASEPAPPSPVAARVRGSAFSWPLLAAVIVGDQVAKAIVRAKLAPFDSLTIIPGWVDFIHVRNAGVAFGILNETAMNQTVKTALTTGLAATALLGIAFYARMVHEHERMARWGLSLIIGGAVGNLLDRIRVGYVLDYVDVFWRGWHFWAFNIADASITIGAVLVFLDLLLVSRHAPHSV
jgi:signal peptidase II